MTNTLLPNNATSLERAIALAAARVSGIPVPIGDFWSPDSCPAALLPWLAWALSADDWDSGWPDEVKRNVIRASIEVHRHKGTVWAMRRAMVAAGLGDAELQEGYSTNLFGGAITYDGTQTHHSSDHWAEYRVVLTRPMSIDQATMARSILEAAAPTRCHLKVLTFDGVAHLYDQTTVYDGQYTYGAA